MSSDDDSKASGRDKGKSRAPQDQVRLTEYPFSPSFTADRGRRTTCPQMMTRWRVLGTRGKGKRRKIRFVSVPRLK